MDPFSSTRLQSVRKRRAEAFFKKTGRWRSLTLENTSGFSYRIDPPMTSTVIAPPSPATVAVSGTDAVFPVRRIFCVGRNYAAHAREMGADPTKEAPFFFCKPADAVVPSGAILPYPLATHDLHHEVELVLALKAGGSNLSTAEAAEALYGVGVGVDLTRRDLQADAKKAGRPWDMAKGFDRSAPLGAVLPLAAPLDHVVPPSAGIRLTVNGAVRQDGRLGDMILSPLEVIAHLSQLVALAAGDLIFTGTPEGVAALVSGDVVQAEIDGLPPLQFQMA